MDQKDTNSTTPTTDENATDTSQNEAFATTATDGSASSDSSGSEGADSGAASTPEVGAPSESSDMGATSEDSMPEAPEAPASGTEGGDSTAASPDAGEEAPAAGTPSDSWSPPSAPTQNMDDKLGGIPGVSPDAMTAQQQMPQATPSQVPGDVAAMPSGKKKMLVALGVLVVIILLGVGVWYIAF